MSSILDPNSIAAGDLKNLLAEKPETVLVDLLPHDHYVNQHIPGAQNACVFQVSFLDDIVGVAPNKQVPIVVYGASPNSQDAAIALEKLDRAGYEKNGARSGMILRVRSPTNGMTRKRW